MKKTIYLLKIGDIDPGILIILKKNLKWFFKKFKIKIDVLPDQFPLLDSEKIYKKENIDEEENYNVVEIKKRIIAQFENRDYYRILGIMEGDIHSNFTANLFGIADIPRNKSFVSAIISVLRLKEDGIYRRPKNAALFEQRIFKIAIHELGHTFGLEHCEDHCVMLRSHVIEDVDKKPHEFCPMCLYKLKKYVIGSN